MVRDWAVIGADDLDVTVEMVGEDPEALADRVASWAQQEADRWPDMGLVYMLVTPEELAAVRLIEGAPALPEEERCPNCHDDGGPCLCPCHEDDKREEWP